MKYGFYGWDRATITDTRGLTPLNYYDLLSGIWCEETCAPRMRKDWTIENRTLGQCSITAFLIQDIYGGKVYGVPLGDGNYHCFNDVEGCVFDLRLSTGRNDERTQNEIQVCKVAIPPRRRLHSGLEQHLPCTRGCGSLR